MRQKIVEFYVLYENLTKFYWFLFENEKNVSEYPMSTQTKVKVLIKNPKRLWDTKVYIDIIII